MSRYPSSPPETPTNGTRFKFHIENVSVSDSASESLSDISTESSLTDSTQESLSSNISSHFAPQLRTSAAEDILNLRASTLSNSVQPQMGSQANVSDVIYSTKGNLSSVVEHPQDRQMHSQDMEVVGMSGSVDPRDNMVLYNSSHSDSVPSHLGLPTRHPQETSPHELYSFRNGYQSPIDGREDNGVIYRTTTTRSEGHNNQLQLASLPKPTYNGLRAERNNGDASHEYQQRDNLIRAITAFKIEQESQHRGMCREIDDLRIKLKNLAELSDLRNHNCFAGNNDPIQYPSFVGSGHPELPRLKKDLQNLSYQRCQVAMRVLYLPEGPADEPLNLKQQRIAKYLGCWIWM